MFQPSRLLGQQLRLQRGSEIRRNPYWQIFRYEGVIVLECIWSREYGPNQNKPEEVLLEDQWCGYPEIQVNYPWGQFDDE